MRAWIWHDTARHCDKQRTSSSGPYGGVSEPAGTRFVGEVGDSTVRHRLIPFIYSTETGLCAGAWRRVMRVYARRERRIVESSPGVPFELSARF